MSSPQHDEEEIYLLRQSVGLSREGVSLLRQVVDSLKQIRDLLKPHFPVRGILTQGEDMVTGTIKGLVPGASDQFFCTPVDVNGNPDQLPAGSPTPSFTASDPTVTIGPPTVADPTGNSCTVTAPTGATVGGSFTLTWSASYTNPAGAAVNISDTATVPYLAPPALLPVGGVISQGSPAA